MRKVMFLMQNLTGGGAEKVLIDILNNIDTKKFKVDLILLQNEGVYLNSINKNINVKKIFGPGKWYSRILFRLVKYFPKQLYKAIIKEKYDVEIAFLEGISTKLVSHSNNPNSKKIAWIHTDMETNKWTDVLYSDREQDKCYNRFDDIVFVSKDARDAFNRRFKVDKPKKNIIHNPVICDDIIKKCNQCNINYDEFTIVSVGRLNERKGFDLLIKAHSKLVKEFKHKLVIIGDGEERSNLEDLINELNVQNSVNLKGFISNPYPYIAACDLFVCSSRTEGFPLVVAEAIILEKPVLSTRVVGPVEILDNGEYGKLCDVTEESILAGIKEILGNNSLLEFYKQKSKERKSYFDYKRVINEIEELLE